MQLGICCSPLQRQLAGRLVERLGRNLGIKAVVIVTDEAAPLMETWEQASASDAVLLMLDRDSAPGPVKREAWQSLLDHNGEPPVATLRLEACAYPKLLERSRFFAPPGGDELAAERWVECWLVSLLTNSSHAEMQGILRAADHGHDAQWWASAVDTPGVLIPSSEKIDAVQTFAAEAAAHFHGVIWLGLEGLPPEAQQARIEHHCTEAAAEDARFLLVLVYAAPGLAIPATGRHSFVILEGGPPETSEANSAFWAALAGTCRRSGFPAVLLDLMAGFGSRQQWAKLVVPLTADARWFRPRANLGTNAEACQRHFETLQEVFRFWRSQRELCRELAGEAAWAIERHCGLGLGPGELCQDLALFLLEEKRMMEAVAWFRMLALAEDEKDEFAIRAREELRWLVDEFGSYRRPEPILPGDQAAFDFPGFVPAPEPGLVDHYVLLRELELEAASQRLAERSQEGWLAGRQLDLFRDL